METMKTVKKVSCFLGVPITKVDKLSVEVLAPEGFDFTKHGEEMAFAIANWDIEWFDKHSLRIVGPVRRLPVDLEERDSPYFIAISCEDKQSGPSSAA